MSSLSSDDVDRRTRFNHVFQSLLSALATPECPLVIFLDDLQCILSLFLVVVHPFKILFSRG